MYHCRVPEDRRVESYFDRIAETYRDERYGVDADPWRAYFFGERLRHSLDLLGPVPGLLLDLGSGPGVLDDAVEGRVVHLDLSHSMLREAGGAAVRADALRVPLRDGTVEAVAALGLSTYLPDLAPLLAEARRVLEPGGRLLLSVTLRASPDTILRTLFRRLVGGSVRGVLGSGMPWRTYSEGEAVRALRRGGFRVRGSRVHNYTVFPLGYLARGLSIRLARRLERGRPRALRGLASDLLLLAERSDAPPPPRRKRVARVIARLNVGGPARQAILLGERLDPRRFETTLVTGRVDPHEGDFLPAARDRGLDPVVIDGLGRAISPLDDLKAFVSLLRLLLAERPDIVHTHTAKAGALGRVAAILAGVPVRIHTFHGHVLHGYFGRAGSALARAVERALTMLSTRVVAVSDEVRDDLTLRHRVAPRSRVDVVPLGLDLTALLACEGRQGELRRELSLSPKDALVGVVGRITAVKEPDLALEVARRVVRAEPRALILFVGGGDLAEETRRAARDSGLGDRVRFLGWRQDLDVIMADLDVALLTSRNEGTPVALIEAAAAGVPAVATRVGGVPAVVEDGVTGLLAPAGDADALADSVLALLRDPARRRGMGTAARERVRERFSAERLLRDIERLYLLSCSRRLT